MGNRFFINNNSLDYLTRQGVNGIPYGVFGLLTIVAGVFTYVTYTDYTSDMEIQLQEKIEEENQSIQENVEEENEEQAEEQSAQIQKEQELEQEQSEQEKNEQEKSEQEKSEQEKSE